jgi:hypothetical protein
MSVRPLTTAFVFTAITTVVASQIPSASDELRSGILLDLAPFLAVSGFTAIEIRRLRHDPRIRQALPVAAYLYFSGALIGALGSAHLAAVSVASIERWTLNEFAYDFRFVSLLQLGVSLVAGGFIAAYYAVRTAIGEQDAWRVSLGIWTAILAINLALVPLQGFARLFSLLAAIALAMLVRQRRSFSQV